MRDRNLPSLLVDRVTGLGVCAREKAAFFGDVEVERRIAKVPSYAERS